MNRIVLFVDSFIIYFNHNGTYFYGKVSFAFRVNIVHHKHIHNDVTAEHLSYFNANFFSRMNKAFMTYWIFYFFKSVYIFVRTDEIVYL